jgi:hypothetical protein
MYAPPQYGPGPYYPPYWKIAEKEIY